MKTCPTCKARCFDDMEICYGCMHRFEEDPPSFEEDFEAGVPEEERPPAPIENESAPGDAQVTEPAVDADAFDDAAREGVPKTAAHALPCFEPIVGPVAIASLGNGYRMVMSIERE